MTSWTFASDPWDRDLPIDPPMSDHDRYEGQFEQWLTDHYDPETKTVFGLDPDNDDDHYNTLFDKFMDEKVYDRWGD